MNQTPFRKPSLYTCFMQNERPRHEWPVVVRPLVDAQSLANDREYWLSRPPHERMEAVEILRKECYGMQPRLARVARVVQLSQS